LLTTFQDRAKLIGIIDESTPHSLDGRVFYSLALIILERSVADILKVDLPYMLSRKKPFHWADEGPQIKGKIVERIRASEVKIHLAAALVVPANQSQARSDLYENRPLPCAVHGGVTDFIIEGRSHSQNNAETQFIRNWYRQEKISMPNISHDSKDSPLTWVADASAGIWSDVLLGRGEGALEKLANHRRVVHAWWQEG
jgi:hypothetical protein